MGARKRLLKVFGKCANDSLKFGSPIQGPSISGEIGGFGEGNRVHPKRNKSAEFYV
jgi:hypothetical protein